MHNQLIFHGKKFPLSDKLLNKKEVEFIKAHLTAIQRGKFYTLSELKIKDCMPSIDVEVYLVKIGKDIWFDYEQGHKKLFYKPKK